MWHKPNLSILRVCQYVSRFSGRGRWILCIVVDVAEIVGVAMQKWAWPPNFAWVSLSVSYKVGNYDTFPIMLKLNIECIAISVSHVLF